MSQRLTSEGVGWRSWPETAVQLAALTRGLVDLERAARHPAEIVAVVDLDGLTAVVELILERKGKTCHSLSR